MLIRRSLDDGGCESTTRGGHRLGLEKIVPSVEARSRNGTLVTSVLLLFEVFASSHSSGLRSFHWPMKNDRRFSIRSKIEKWVVDSGLIIFSPFVVCSLDVRRNFGHFQTNCHAWQISWNTPQTYPFQPQKQKRRKKKMKQIGI